MEDSKKYDHMENVFQYINSNYVSLDKEQIKINNVILIQLIDELISKMKEANVLFKNLYRKIFYGGSYYDDLKISKPEEYDCDILLKIPSYAEPAVIMAEKSGFVQIQLKALEKFKKQPEFTANYSDLEKCLLDTDNYFRVDKLKQWMDKIFQKAFNQFPAEDGYNYLYVGEKKYYFKKSKTGPAFTVHLCDSISDQKLFMDIDLVPCFEFKDTLWPKENQFRQNPSEIYQTFFAVPKKPSKVSHTADIDRCWRLSFQQQEAEIMKERQSLKPALKLLKKLRDNYNHVSISSYFIKTIFLWEIEKLENSFWKQNLSTVFIEMLKIFTGYVDKKCIPYYWDSRFNLIGDVKEAELFNIKNKYKNILSDIDRNITDPHIAAKYLVPKEDLPKLIENVSIGKKYEKHCVDGNMLLYFRSPSLNTSISYSSESKSDVLTSILKEVREVNSKVDNFLKEQETIKELLQQVADKQNEFENKLRDNQILSVQREKSHSHFQ